jgi:hypothetical protein
MPKTKEMSAKVKKSAKAKKSDSVTLRLQSGAITEVLPEFAPMLNMHRKPLIKSWAYAQNFDTLMRAYSLLNQVMGVLELLKIASLEEGKKLSAQETRFQANVVKSLSLIDDVLRGKARRYA